MDHPSGHPDPVVAQFLRTTRRAAADTPVPDHPEVHPATVMQPPRDVEWMGMTLGPPEWARIDQVYFYVTG